MRCGRAQQWMTVALDGELSARRRRSLDRHLERCAACRVEMAASARLVDVLRGLPAAADVPAEVEQATLRRVRIMAAEEGERRAARAAWLRVLLPAVASAGIVVLAAVSTLRVPAARPAERRAPGRRAAAERRPEKPVRMANADGSHATVPPGPPAALAAAPELFVDLPLLHNMEKLEHFEAIRTTTLDDDVGTPGQAPQSNG